MLSSGILDFAIGLVFTFLAVSLAAGAATETVASVLKWRSHTLLQGIKSLLNDPNATALAGALYKHGLINPRSDGSKATNWRTNPAYIDADHFATALLDSIKGLPNPPVPKEGDPPNPAPAPGKKADAPPAVIELHNQIAKLQGQGDKSGQLRKMLYGIVERAEGDERKIRTELSTWFDNAMDRVSGAYKRWAQLWSFLLALIIAALLNISTIDIAKSLWRQPIDTKMIAAVPEATAQNALPEYLKALDMLPIGWPNGFGQKLGLDKQPTCFGASDWGLTFIGWLITAFATLFGAPFWFDGLQQIIRLKGAGPSPSEKGTNAAASK